MFSGGVYERLRRSQLRNLVRRVSVAPDPDRRRTPGAGLPDETGHGAPIRSSEIKPLNPSAPPRGRLTFVPAMTPPARLIIANATLKDLIARAYSCDDYQITNGPAWIGSARFDVEGKTTGNVTREQRLLMLRTLLTERFNWRSIANRRNLPSMRLKLAGKRRTFVR